MDRYKFRGKRLDNGEWVYGWFHKIDRADSLDRAFIVPSHASYLYSEEVDPSTVGQYIGPKDRNGKEAYKGDIVRYPDAYTNTGDSGDWEEIVSTGEIKWDAEQAQYYVTNRESIETEEFWERFDEAEIIGNIHDNSEMLGGPEDE